jgi:hypothetical protein
MIIIRVKQVSQIGMNILFLIVHLQKYRGVWRRPGVAEIQPGIFRQIQL